MKKKNTKKFKPPKEVKKRIFPTVNAEKIAVAMKSNGIRGKYKDHVLIVGGQLIDWLGTYNLFIDTDEGEKRYGVEGAAVVHKRNLTAIIGVEWGDRFWKCNMRTNWGVESRRARCITK